MCYYYHFNPDIETDKSENSIEIDERENGLNATEKSEIPFSANETMKADNETDDKYWESRIDIQFFAAALPGSSLQFSECYVMLMIIVGKCDFKAFLTEFLLHI